METVDEFRSRFRSTLAPHLSSRNDVAVDEDAIERAHRHRRIQRTLFDHGFAGVLYPPEYGGLGLTWDHQRAFLDEASSFELPRSFNLTLGILGPVLLDFGTEEQRRRWIPAMLRGDDYWVQLLSEPGGGSDMAGATTSARADGEMYVVNGAKMWTSNAHFASWGMALVRTDWDRPKHRGLTMIAIPMDDPRVTVRPIRLANGDARFCEEFFDDLVVPVGYRIGPENDGWTVASRMLVHQRNMVGGNSLDGGLHETPGPPSRHATDPLVELAHQLGRNGDPGVRQLVAEGHIASLALREGADRVGRAVRAGALPASASSIPKLLRAVVGYRRAQIALDIAGSAALVEGGPHSRIGTEWIVAKTQSLAGGTNEMQRNIIAERLLGLPREHSLDLDVPFKDVRRNRNRSRPAD